MPFVGIQCFVTVYWKQGLTLNTLVEKGINLSIAFIIYKVLFLSPPKIPFLVCYTWKVNVDVGKEQDHNGYVSWDTLN